MAYTSILYGPDSEVFNTYSAVSPPPRAANDGQIARRYQQFLGQQLVLADGRKFRFGVAGGSTLVIGNVVCGPVATTSQQNRTPAATAADATQVSLTTGASSAINTFAEGFLSVSVAPGSGQIYKIASHLLMTSGAGDLVNLAAGHAIRVALTTTSRVDLYQNSYDGLLQSPATTLASAVMGVAVSAPTTRLGAWIQTHGMASVLTAGTLIAGTRAVAGSSTAGSAAPETASAATSKLEVTIGITFFAAAAGAWSGVFLTLDG